MQVEKGAKLDRWPLMVLSPLIALIIGALAGCSPGSDRPNSEQPGLQALVPAPGSPLVVPFAPGGVVLGDVDNDGLLDLLVRSAESAAVAVLMGSGEGRFRTAAGGLVDLQEPASEFALGDLNGDGWLDLVLGSHNSYRVQLLLGDGAGNFEPVPGRVFTMKDGQEPHTHGLALGDLNNDGRLDIITGNTSDGDVAVALGDGMAGFTRLSGSPFAVSRGPYPLALGDLDSDGNLDIVVTSTHNQDGHSGVGLTLLLGDGKGRFERSLVPLRTPDPWFVAIGDLNGDRNPDLVTSHWESRELSVLVGMGDGTFTEVSDSPFDLGHPTWYLGIADVDGDGDDDVAAASDRGVRLMLGDGSGGFTPAAGSPYPTDRGSWRLAIGDLNGDGFADVATSNLEGNSVTVLLAR